MGISSYNDLRYDIDPAFAKLFEYKGEAVFRSIERLCSYFRGKGFKICLDLFAPFIAYFVGQDYHKLLQLTDIVKPMMYNITNAPAGIPFEVNQYACAFDNCPENVLLRKNHLLKTVDYDNDFIKREVDGILQVIKQNNLDTKLHVGVEINYMKDIAPVTKEYIEKSYKNVANATGLIASWDLNTIPDDNLDTLLRSM